MCTMGEFWLNWPSKHKIDDGDKSFFTIPFQIIFSLAFLLHWVDFEFNFYYTFSLNEHLIFVKASKINFKQFKEHLTKRIYFFAI